jgi:uncharacterized delta-60 repeat protein
VKRSLAIVFFSALACGPSGGPFVQPPSTVPPMTLTSQAIVVVAPNTTTSLLVVVDSDTETPATISLGPLPPGVSSTPVAWNGQSNVTIEITASADAPIAEQIVNVNAIIDSTSAGTTTTTLDVSSLDGALDPAFGTNGLFTLPVQADASATGIASLSNDDWLVVGATTAGNFVVASVTSDGTLDTTYGAGGLLPTTIAGLPLSFDVDANGNALVVAGTQTSTNGTVLDASGNVVATIPLSNGSSLVGWDGAGAFVAGNALTHLDASYTPTSYPFLDTNDDATALLVRGGFAYVAVLDASTYVEKLSSLGELDTTFGGQEGASIGFNTDITALAMDENGRLLVGSNDTLLAITRLLPNGEPDISFGQGSGNVTIDPREASTIVPIGIFPRQNGTILVVAELEPTGLGTDASGILIVRLNDDGSLDTSFGTYGLSRTQNAQSLVVLGAAFDENTKRLCTVSDADAQISSVLVACYHIGD